MVKKILKITFKYGLIFLSIFTLLLYGYEFYLKRAYPLHYHDFVQEACQKYNVEKELVFAVIREESKFKKEACSHAGAIGLMQIMPETFFWLQKNNSAYEMDENHLKDPKVNIEYGTYLLSLLQKKYSEKRTALCAYNAGIGNVDKWLKNKDYSDDGKNLKVIPFKETKNYVDDVINSEQKYKGICKKYLS